MVEPSTVVKGFCWESWLIVMGRCGILGLLRTRRKQPELPLQKPASSPLRSVTQGKGTPAAYSSWEPVHRHSWVGTVSRLLLMLIVLAMLVIPFTPLASKIKESLTDLIERSRKDRIVVQEKSVLKEVIHMVPAPPPPLPSKFVPRKDVDVATLFNGITIETHLETTEGNYASLEVGSADAYKVEFALKVHVPKPNETVSELARLNPHLPKMLPALGTLLEHGKVSGFWHKLYENKVDGVQKNLTRLNRLLDKHNFFDCETILELQHPESGRRALLVQSEMDVVCDGSDGDRQSEMSTDIYNSDYYQPFTSYEWAKQGTTANPLMAKWAARRDALKKEAGQKGTSTARANELKAQARHLEEEIKAMKARSSLIGEKDPFIVISLLFKDYPRVMAQAPAMGDYCAVIHNDKIYPAICGDYGPSMKVGEASLLIAKKINPKATPANRGEDDLKVTYLIFPGTADKPFGPPSLDKWHEKISGYLAEMGGLGDGYTLYQWEDQFPKPKPETPLLAQSGDKKPDDAAAADPKLTTPPAATDDKKPDAEPAETVKKADPAPDADAAPSKPAAETVKASGKTASHKKRS
jgi:glycosyl hydrolase group 75 (putative chitosanase)